MDTTTKIACPACSGTVVYDNHLKMPKCSRCDLVYNAEIVDRLVEHSKLGSDVLEWQMPDRQFSEAAADAVRFCPACGSMFRADGKRRCPACNATAEASKSPAKKCCPELFLPFVLDKNAAIDALLDRLRGISYLPKEMTDSYHLQEMQKVYLPFWMFQPGITAEYSYRAKKYYQRHYETVSKSRYREEKREYYCLKRRGNIAYSPLLFSALSDASAGFRNIAGRVYSEDLREFRPEDLEDCTVRLAQTDPKKLVQGINKQLTEMTDTLFQASLAKFGNIDSALPTVLDGLKENLGLTEKKHAIILKEGKAKYVLLPFWILNTEWEGKQYRTVINGRTGEMTGSIPCDRRKRRGYLGRIFLSTAALAGALTAALWPISNTAGRVFFIMLGLLTAIALTGILSSRKKRKRENWAPTDEVEEQLCGNLDLLESRDVHLYKNYKLYYLGKRGSDSGMVVPTLMKRPELQKDENYGVMQIHDE